MNITDAARQFGKLAHAGQTRKYTGNDYFDYHCVPVALAVKTFCATEPEVDLMVAAAYLHDTVEDTPVTIELIDFAFGSRVRELVNGLTEKSTKADGNRAIRKRIDREFLSTQDKQVQLIKLADIMNNSHDIVFQDPEGFAPRYLGEMGLLIPALTKTSGHPLRKAVDAQHEYLCTLVKPL